MPGTPFSAETRINGDSTVIDLKGDIDRNAKDALEAAYTRAAAQGPVILNFTEVDYINSTGIAVIVALLARRQNRRPAAQGLRTERPLPRDLPDHAPGRFHEHLRRRAGRPGRRVIRTTDGEGTHARSKDRNVGKRARPRDQGDRHQRRADRLLRTGPDRGLRRSRSARCQDDHPQLRGARLHEFRRNRPAGDDPDPGPAQEPAPGALSVSPITTGRSSR